MEKINLINLNLFIEELLLLCETEEDLININKKINKYKNKYKFNNKLIYNKLLNLHHDFTSELDCRI